MWTPPEDVERILSLQTASRLDRFAKARAVRQAEIAEAMSARGLARSSDHMRAVVDATAELWSEAAAGIIADHLAIAADIGAGAEELDGLRERVSRLFADAQHGVVSSINELIAGEISMWQPLVDRMRNAISDTRRDGEIAFGREKLRKQTQFERRRAPDLPPATRRDFFLSHAFEDKASIARPLGEQLKQCGHSVWFDEYELTVGDSLRQKIDRGLVDSRFGIVVLSPSFFAKPWPRYELDSLVTKAMIADRKVILPVWHHIGRDEIAGHSPKLADLLGVDSARGVEEVAAALIRALHAAL
jgi:hypothetical protein